MYQPKVKQTQKYSDSQGEHVVCKGKLILLDKLNLETYAMKGDLAKSDKTGKLYIHNGGVLSSKKIYPIIISETEEMEVGDYVYVYKQENLAEEIFKVENEAHLIHVKNSTNCYKILAFPEYFSDKHLQAIVDGKMKDGDEVLVKCETKYNGDGYVIEPTERYRQIYLNQQNYITLFPAQQSLEEAAEQAWNYFKPHTPKDKREAIRLAFIKAYIQGAEWAKKNNY